MDNDPMDIIMEILDNRILITALICWLCAQVIKVIVNAALTNTLDWRRLIGDGGMPSAHSATVTGLAVMTGLEAGFDSPAFAISVVLAIVVMHDATGVRYETQKQASAIEELVSYFNELLEENISLDVKLKKFVGHSKMQVFVGGIVGLVASILVYMFT